MVVSQGCSTDVYSFRLCSEVLKHCECALGDITLRYQYKEFFKGLSIAMSQTYNKVECVHAQIIVNESLI
jgi:hypothetical protein